jgi:hypothetical protein
VRAALVLPWQQPDQTLAVQLVLAQLPTHMAVVAAHLVIIALLLAVVAVVKHLRGA